MLREEHAEGKAEGMLLGKAEDILELLKEFDTLPDEVHERILTETNLEQLKIWLKLAAKANSLEQFLEEM